MGNDLNENHKYKFKDTDGFTVQPPDMQKLIKLTSTLINETLIDSNVNYYNQLNIAQICNMDILSDNPSQRGNPKNITDFSNNTKYLNSCFDIYTQPKNEYNKIYASSKDKDSIKTNKLLDNVFKSIFSGYSSTQPSVKKESKKEENNEAEEDGYNYQIKIIPNKNSGRTSQSKNIDINLTEILRNSDKNKNNENERIIIQTEASNEKSEKEEFNIPFRKKNFEDEDIREMGTPSFGKVPYPSANNSNKEFKDSEHPSIKKFYLNNGEYNTNQSNNSRKISPKSSVHPSSKNSQKNSPIYSQKTSPLNSQKNSQKSSRKNSQVMIPEIVIKREDKEINYDITNTDLNERKPMYRRNSPKNSQGDIEKEMIKPKINLEEEGQNKKKFNIMDMNLEFQEEFDKSEYKTNETCAEIIQEPSILDLSQKVESQKGSLQINSKPPKAIKKIVIPKKYIKNNNSRSKNNSPNAINKRPTTPDKSNFDRIVMLRREQKKTGTKKEITPGRKTPIKKGNERWTPERTRVKKPALINMDININDKGYPITNRESNRDSAGESSNKNLKLAYGNYETEKEKEVSYKPIYEKKEIKIKQESKSPKSNQTISKKRPKGENKMIYIGPQYKGKSPPKGNSHEGTSKNQIKEKISPRVSPSRKIPRPINSPPHKIVKNQSKHFETKPKERTDSQPKKNLDTSFDEENSDIFAVLEGVKIKAAGKNDKISIKNLEPVKENKEENNKDKDEESFGSFSKAKEDIIRFSFGAS
ncbi:MAG: hypothetical protein MJ252_22045 [archaeon]|nr:hypothetical protein [archaeon]